MPLAKEILEEHAACCGPFPEKGDLILFKTRQGYFSAGRVSVVWLAQPHDTRSQKKTESVVVIDVRATEGDFFLYKKFGDLWVPATKELFDEQYAKAQSTEQDERTDGTAEEAVVRGSSRSRKAGRAEQQEDAAD